MTDTFQGARSELRADLALVADLVPRNSHVLDLGCGSGRLLRFLMDHKGCTGTGVDGDAEMLVQAISRGVPAIQLDLDSELGEFHDASYDVVVLSRTLQAIRRPAHVLAELGRIGTRCIISMPNFGYWRNRASIVTGRMPISKQLPYHWHDSPNLRYTTLKDLEDFFEDAGYTVERRIGVTDAGVPLHRGDIAINLRAGAAIYVLRRDRESRI